jgi:hypothetical protein
MLLDTEFAHRPAPQEVWLDAIEHSPVITEAPLPAKPKSKVRKLRRMQSQNFIERTIYNVVCIFGVHLESA